MTGHSITTAEFWSDPAPTAMTAPAGVHPMLANDTPDHHLLFATSGSSDAPKWIALSKNALLASAAAVNHHLRVTPASVWGLALPVHHVGGFGVAARAYEAGCGLETFAAAWHPRAFRDWAAAHHLSHTSLVPTQVHDLVGAGCQAPPALRAVVVGGGRLDAAAGQAARALGWPVLASYGMTEAASQIATQPLDALAHPYSPAPITVLPHWQVRSDAEGCLEISGPALFSGILVNNNYQPRTDDWHATRDRVAITDAGLVPHGRADDLVKIAGELVDPRDIEARLAAALGPHAAAIAVTAVADARLDHRLAIAAESSVSDALLAAAIAAHNAGVPRSQRLGTPVRLARLPRTPLGKIQQETLRAMLSQPPS